MLKLIILAFLFVFLLGVLVGYFMLKRWVLKLIEENIALKNSQEIINVLAQIHKKIYYNFSS